jgi:hypothetical protein
MCWNAGVSLQSFLVGLSAIGIGALKGVPISVLFFLFTISLMQLIEYAVWSELYDNRTLSILASWLLWLQPVASISLLSDSSLRNAFLAIYAVLSGLVGDVWLKDNYSMTRAPNGHLQWNWIPANFARLAVYFVFLFVPALLIGQFSYAMIAAITLGISLFTYWKDNTWGSMWCWIINFGVPSYVLIRAVLSS